MRNTLDEEDQLVDLTKKKLNYTDEPAGTCGSCKYSEGTSDWETLCKYSNLVIFTVSSHGRCDRFKQRTK